MAEPFTRQKWSLWVQPDGPNTEMRYLGCHTLDDIEAPGQGIGEIIRCFRPDGSGWNVLASTKEPPDFITTTITGLIEPTADWLERIVEAGCQVPLYVNGSTCPPFDVWRNTARSYLLEHAELGTHTLMGLASREEDGVSEQSFEVSAWPPLLKARAMTLGRQDIAEYSGANDVHFISRNKCADDCGAARAACSYGVLVSDAPSGSPAVEGDVWYTQDGGATWTVCAAAPFAAAEDIFSAVIFQIGPDTYRLLVAREADAADNMEVAYSDDWGANWTLVDVNTPNNVGANREGALFLLDAYHIWLCLDDGYIFFSDDFGETWTEQADGSASAADLNEVWFADADNGMAVGDGDVVLVTTNGGSTWSLATATGSGNDLLCCSENGGGSIWWVGESGGDLYYSNDHGTTWTQRPFAGDGVGRVHDVEFVNTLVGFLLHDNATPVGSVYRTRNGGTDWELMPDVTNIGLNSLHGCNVNLVYAVGEPQPGGGGGTAVVLQGTD